MKWRNQLLALFCLIVFAGFGVFYFQHWVVQKPFGIILFIGEGLTPGRLAATRVYGGGADVRLTLDRLEHSALATNFSNDFATPDSASAGSAIATGTKVNNRALAVDPNGKQLKNILDLAREQGRATGLITDGKLTNATAAAFYAHIARPDDRAEIARALAEAANIDIVLGGGAADFLPETKNGARHDQRDLVLEMQRAGYEIVRSKAELEAVPSWRRAKVFGVFSNSELAFSDEMEARSDQPSLADMVRRAIELLQSDPGGYLLIVDAGLMRKAAIANEGERTLAETVELDRALETAWRYIGAKSTIIVAGDMGVGGLNLSGFPFRKDRGMALLGLDSAGEPRVTWATGPNGRSLYGAAQFGGENGLKNSSTQPPEEPAAFYLPFAQNTVDDVLVSGTGFGTEAIHGTIDNTKIFEILRDQL